MWLMGYPNPFELQESWDLHFFESVYLQEHKMGTKNFFHLHDSVISLAIQLSQP